MTARRGVVILACLVLAGVIYAYTPAPLEPYRDIPGLPPIDALDDWLEDRERSIRPALVPGTEKRIAWQQPGRKTPLAIVYLHGFSGSRQEIAPTAERVAGLLGANLFETRLADHGLSANGLGSAVAEDWLADAAEALAIGAAIGDRVIVIGTSTGATLAAAIADHPLMEAVSHMIWISPNFGVRDERASLATGPAGELIARLVAGETRSFATQNDAHATYWTTRYPTTAAVEMLRLVRYVDELAVLPVTADLLMIYSPDDQVISVAAADAAFERTLSGRRKRIAFREADDPLQHVISGDILSPSATEKITEMIAGFVLPPQTTTADEADAAPVEGEQ